MKCAYSKFRDLVVTNMIRHVLVFKHDTLTKRLLNFGTSGLGGGNGSTEGALLLEVSENKLESSGDECNNHLRLDRNERHLDSFE